MTIRTFQDLVVSIGFAFCGLLADIADGWITSISMPVAIGFYALVAMTIREYLVDPRRPQ